MWLQHLVLVPQLCSDTANSGTCATDWLPYKPPCVLCKLFLHSCLWLIKLTTTVILVLAIAKVPESAVGHEATL